MEFSKPISDLVLDKKVFFQSSNDSFSIYLFRKSDRYSQIAQFLLQQLSESKEIKNKK
ncbi:hypothetical protein ACTFIW_012064 [Dictyostelium discoideum]